MFISDANSPQNTEKMLMTISTLDASVLRNKILTKDVDKSVGSCRKIFSHGPRLGIK